MAQSDTLNFPR